jgi:oxygen-independent coproporphyrinogen-3 oxidase
MEHSLYIHIPFCRHRCHYCDFITTAGQEGLLPVYVGALKKELRIVNKDRGKYPVHSIYLGGGTPSLVSVPLLADLLTTISKNFILTEDCEISLEANPGTISSDYLQAIREMGVNRLSLGVQSTDTFDLQRLDRIHTIQDVIDSVGDARSAGFSNINLDLIFGLPWQNLKSWENSLERAIALNPDHFSLYALIVEPGTPLYGWYQHGLIAEQDQDLEADMYNLAMDRLSDAGYTHYEISNWAKIVPERDFRCQHNLQYWLNQPYFGIGVGAHGYIDHVRTVNTPLIPDYIQRMNNQTGRFPYPQTPGTTSTEIVNVSTQMRDEMMLGLRLVQEGVSRERFRSRFQADMVETFQREIEKLLDVGLVEFVGKDQDRLRLTRRGIPVANQAFMEFV